jgi:hypothetical protein
MRLRFKVFFTLVSLYPVNAVRVTRGLLDAAE